MGGKYPSISTITGYRECFRLYRGLGRIGGIFPSNNNVMAHEETMADETLHLGISYEKGIDPKTVADFEADVATQGLVVKTNERSKSGPFAGIEWLLPTAIMVIIAKPYFDSFLREAGKDHYHILKKNLSNLVKSFWVIMLRQRRLYIRRERRFLVHLNIPWFSQSMAKLSMD